VTKPDVRFVTENGPGRKSLWVILLFISPDATVPTLHSQTIFNAPSANLAFVTRRITPTPLASVDALCLPQIKSGYIEQFGSDGRLVEFVERMAFSSSSMLAMTALGHLLLGRAAKPRLGFK
jgi:hypothetical protein